MHAKSGGACAVSKPLAKAAVQRFVAIWRFLLNLQCVNLGRQLLQFALFGCS